MIYILRREKLPINVTAVGRVRDTQSLKTLSPSVIKCGGRVMATRDKHPHKPLLSIDVTVVGRVMGFRYAHSYKDSLLE